MKSLVLGGEGLDRRDRAEDLLTGDPRAGGDVREDGGGIEVTGAVRQHRSGPYAGAGGDRLVDQAGDASTLALVDQWPEVAGGVGACAEGQCVHARGELVGEFVDDVGMDVEAVGGDAGLTNVAQLGGHRAVDRGVQVGVLAHDERRVAAQLHRGAQHGTGGLREQQASDGRGPGEGQFAQPAVLDKGLGDGGGTGGGEDVEDAVGQARVGEHTGECGRRERCLRGGFDDHGAAGRHRRPDLAGGHGQWCVPRCYQQAGAHRLPGDQDPGRAVFADLPGAVDTDGFLAEPAQVVRAVLDFCPGLGQ